VCGAGRQQSTLSQSCSAVSTCAPWRGKRYARRREGGCRGWAQLHACSGDTYMWRARRSAALCVRGACRTWPARKRAWWNGQGCTPHRRLMRRRVRQLRTSCGRRSSTAGCKTTARCLDVACGWRLLALGVCRHDPGAPFRGSAASTAGLTFNCGAAVAWWRFARHMCDVSHPTTHV
jgi:hypothetical protein